MGKKILLVVIILLGITRVPVFSQETTMGTDFWLTFGKNRDKKATEVNLQIRVVATKDTKVTYTFTSNGTSVTKDIAAGEVNTFVLTDAQKSLVYQSGYPVVGTFISKISLHIQSTEPVAVYALNQVKYWTDATNLLPVNTLGKNYHHISYLPSTHGQDVSDGAQFDGYTIVATEDGTNIYVNGSTTPKNATPLTKGQVYNVYEKEIDMTGYHINSNHPIALFSTILCTQVPSGVNASDLLFQQMVPVRAWGRKYFIPASKQGKDRVRIVASRDKTNISQTGGTLISGSLTNLSKGQFVELEINLADGGCYISADKPVGVCSYLVGTTYIGPNNEVGDPSLAWVPPVEQYVDSATIAPFVPGNATALSEHHAQIIARTSSLSETTMRIGTGASSALSGGTWTTGANPDYSFYNLPLTNTSHSYSFANPDGLAVMGYGLGKHESYYYLAASAIRDISAAFYVNEESYLDVNEKKYCGVLNFHIEAVLEYVSEDQGSLEWYIDGQQRKDVTDELEWDLSGLSPGKHTIRMNVRDLSNVFVGYETTIMIWPLRIPVNPPKIRLIK
jgi:hypothetical protein